MLHNKLEEGTSALRTGTVHSACTVRYTSSYTQASHVAIAATKLLVNVDLLSLYRQPKGIGKAAMAAMVATKPKSDAKNFPMLERCGTKSQTTLLLTASLENHFLESGKATMEAMAGAKSNVTQIFYFKTNRLCEMKRNKTLHNFVLQKHSR